MNAAAAIQAVLTKQRDEAMNEAAKAQAQVLVLEAHVAALEQQVAELMAATTTNPQE